MFLTLEKLEARTRQLEQYLYLELQPVTPLAVMEGTLAADEVYLTPPAAIGGLTLNLEDEFNGRDRYLWAQKELLLPHARQGLTLCGLFDFGKTGAGHNSGFESLLYLNGEPYQGVDANHKDVVLEPFAGQEVTLTFLLWSGLEGGGKRQTQFHRIRQAHIGYLHNSTDTFYYLSKAIYKTLALLPDTAPEKYALTKALESAYALINWDSDTFYQTIEPALALLSERLSEIPKHTPVTVNAIGHTHIDVAWLWRLKHTREKAVRSFSTVLRLMEEFDDYLFLQTQPQLYNYVKNDCPALYEKIKERVREGRWEADGGMWVEADCNISSGEALVRQLVHGIRFFKEELGVDCQYLWLPDVFGYSWALPQILKLCNLKTFMTTKISWNQYNTIPNDLFYWRGIDGTEILTYFITTPEIGHPIDSRFSTYNGMLSPRSVLGSWQKFKDKALSDETLISYGYGDGGGGVNRNMLKMRRAMDTLPGLPAVKQSRAGDFFARLHEKVNTTDQYVHTWDGELYLEYHRGTYTSQAHNKQQNRRLEYDIAQCEWLCAAAALSGAPYPQAALHSAWETVLLHQFHDIIPGSSIHEVYEDSDIAYARTAEEVAALCNTALETLITPSENHFTLYHFGSFTRQELVFLPLEGDASFYGENEAPLPAQRAAGGWLVNVTLPALGMTLVTAKREPVKAAPSAFSIDMAARLLSTPFYSIRWDENGRLAEIFDKAHNRQVLAGEGNLLEIYEDKPLHFDNWDIDIFYTQKRELLEAAAPPELLENGGERLVIRFFYTYHLSCITQDMILTRTNRRIDFITHVNWQECDRLLKAAFPVNIRATKATYDIQFGHVERPTHHNTSWDWARFEVVGHKWADLSEPDYGVSLLNDCKYGYNVKDNVLRVTLLKSSKFPDTQADMGEHYFTYSLLPHAGGLSDTIEEGIALNLPAGVVSGIPKFAAPLAAVSTNAMNIDALKKAEGEDCMVLRLHECLGTHAAFEVDFGRPLSAYAPCNLLEENLAEPVCAGKITAQAHPFEIVTYKLWF